MKKNFLKLFTCVMFAISMSTVFGYNQADVNKLIATGICPDGDFSNYKFKYEEIPKLCLCPEIHLERANLCQS